MVQRDDGIAAAREAALDVERHVRLEPGPQERADPLGQRWRPGRLESEFDEGERQRRSRQKSLDDVADVGGERLPRLGDRGEVVEFKFKVSPVLLGAGISPIAGERGSELTLASTQLLPAGVVLNTYLR
ncbi:hypothetical protein BW730_11300 [Tessaracoccus aquimaris]|uniref:Uncharacterized protein n=1 Tax=Tessaracoccus aquimaris TaxID=1332264 RepID=A0A1Q2CPD6_9ACTN|nr:hypothetical protein BW730_11300 [Tessaracoccus aquimaris]